jgi:hypothetical protein
VIPWQDTTYYASYDTASPGVAAVTVALVGIVGFFALVMVAIGLWRQAATRARAAKVAETEADKRALAPGYAIVHGEVETDDDQPAVTVRIHQFGREYNGKGGMRHRWTEFERQVDARPFFLRLASGEKVKVLPGDNVFLVDVLSSDPRPKRAWSSFQVAPKPLGVPFAPQRVRVAELSAKDSAYACGRLAPPTPAVAYRGGEENYTLHPPAGGKMLISAEPLEKRYASRARFHGGWAIALAAALLFANGVLFRAYWMELVWGRNVVANVTQTRTWTTHDKHGPVQHYALNAIANVDGNDAPLASSTNYGFYAFVKAERAAGRPVEVPFIVVPFQVTTADLGTRPTLNLFTCIFSLFFLIAVVVGYLAHARHTRPWYDRKKVIDIGPGPLGYPDRLV